MQIAIERGAKRAILVFACVAISAVLTLQAIKVWTADRWMATGQVDMMERSARLFPGNGEVWDRIGRFRQLDFANPDPNKAMESYWNAVQDNPNWAFYWLDLASAYEDANDLAQAQAALEKAQTAYPVSALVSWSYGNFLVRAGKESEGYRKIRDAVTSDPTLLPLAISRTWRSGESVETLLSEALPVNRDAYLQALAFFTQLRLPDAGLKVWQRIAGLGQKVAISETLQFQHLLIENDRAEDERQVWRQALRLAGFVAGPASTQPPRQSLVWNGDFSNDFINGGLDWRWAPAANVSASFDSAPPDRAGRSIRVDFGGGSNISLEQPLQYVPVEPNRTYQFHGQLRTDQLTTENGAHISIIDPHHQNGVNFASGNLIGSHSWTSVDAKITTGPETHFLLVRLLRLPSRLFENKVSGAVWIADISLTPSGDVERNTP